MGKRLRVDADDDDEVAEQLRLTGIGVRKDASVRQHTGQHG